MPRISVIMPVRDVGAYVLAILGDLQRQTFGDFEILVADDRSTDRTCRIVQEVAEKDERFRLLAAQGQGASAARNTGLMEATGEAIAFVDADDRVAPTYLEALHRSIERTGSDMAACNAQRLDGFRTGASGLHLRAFDHPRSATHMRRSPELVWDSPIWNKLIRRQLWADDGLWFEEGRVINDIYPSLRSHVLSRQVDVLGDVLYYWRIREDPSSSITDSKLIDAAARIRSLEDRLHAVVRTRRMLQADLGDPEVLYRFDERVLTHDVWTYLPLYHTSDETFRKALIEGVAGYLAAFDVEPGRFRLGPVLHPTYEAICCGDEDKVDALLAPEVRAVASSRRGRIVTEVQPPLGTPVRGGQLRRAVTAVKPTRRGSVDIELDTRVSRVHLDPRARGPLDLTGRVRIRDGRSDVEGPWQTAIEVVGQRTGHRLSGTPRPITRPDDHDVHPLRRTGWRPFGADLDPRPIAQLPAERDWLVVVQVRLGDVVLPADHRLTAHASRALGIGIRLGDGTDLVPMPTRSGGLRLRRVPAPVRLIGIRPLVDGALLQVGDMSEASQGLSHLWLRTTDGEVLLSAAPDDDGREWKLRLDTSVLPERSQLWCRIDGRAYRVRAHPNLASVLVGGTGDHELVLRPTLRGQAVLERRAYSASLADLTVEADRLVLRGPPLHPVFGADVGIELRCRWTEDRYRVDVAVDDGGWRAALPVIPLIGSSGGQLRPRPWMMRLHAENGTTAPVRVPVEGRERYPLIRTSQAAVVEGHIGSRSTAVVRVGPPER